jgi:hypothetical protein
MSNIWAENDGVMSMRIGRVFPKKHNSTFNYFIENFGQKIWDKDNSEKLKEIKELVIGKNITAILGKSTPHQSDISVTKLFEFLNSNSNLKVLNAYSKGNTYGSGWNGY